MYVLQTFQIHPSLIHQAIEQLFFYLGATLFNRILTRSELCCRWKAIQIRMNISYIEDWVRTNPIPAPSKDTFTRHLIPVISLVQLLQIITHITTIDTLSETLYESNYLNSLHWSHIRRILHIYTYEIDEPDISNDIIQYINRCSERAMMDTRTLKLWQRGMINDEGENTIRYNNNNGDNGDNGENTLSLLDKPIDLSIMGTNDITVVSSPSAPLPISLSPDCIPPPPMDESNNNDNNNSNNHNHNHNHNNNQLLVRGPMIIVDSHNNYSYLIADETYWLPFAVPCNVGERIILRIIDGDESYKEEAPVISQEVINMLDSK